MSKTILLKKNFHTNLTQQLIEEIQFNRSNYYYFLGKIADSNDSIVETIQSEMQTRAEMVAFKKVSSTDVSYVIDRYDWAPGVVYTEYDSTIDLTGTNFYVMNSAYEVFKCIKNGHGAVSTVEPIKQENSYWQIPSTPLVDGYIWKYMFTVPMFKRNKFLSEIKIPVQIAMSDRFYNSGAISAISIDAQGSDYRPLETNTIVIQGDGVNAEYAPVFDTNGKLVSIETVNPGEGYTYAIATLVSTYGSGAKLSVVLEANDFVSDQSKVETTSINGGIHNIKITQPGTGYTAISIEVVGDGYGFECTPVLSFGRLIDIDITKPGFSYSYANVIITGNNLDNDLLATNAEAYAIISPQFGHGRNAVHELGATSLCLFSNIRRTAFPMTLTQDFREYGIIKNLINEFTGDLSTNTSGLFTYIVTFSTTGTNHGTPINDEILLCGDNKYRVVALINSTSMIVNAIDNNELILFSALASNDADRTYRVDTIETTPDANKYSGKIMFISNSDAFTFSDEQEITIKTYLNL